MTKEKLVILGHPNPDIDSIISGILMEHYINNYTNYQGLFIRLLFFWPFFFRPF